MTFDREQNIFIASLKEFSGEFGLNVCVSRGIFAEDILHWKLFLQEKIISTHRIEKEASVFWVFWPPLHTHTLQWRARLNVDVVTMTTETSSNGSDWPEEGFDASVRRLSYRYTTFIQVNTGVSQRTLMTFTLNLADLNLKNVYFL